MLYYYERWWTYQPYTFGSTTHDSFTTTGSYSMFARVDLNERTGQLTGSGGVGVSPGTYVTGYTFSGSTLIARSYGGTPNRLATSSTPVIRANYRLRDTYRDTIIAGERDYPANGQEGIYWYIRREKAETAKLINPSGGETINDDYTITWEKSSNDVNVDIELSFDDGQTWKTIATNQVGTSLNYNFENENETSTARLRIRPRYGTGTLGIWAMNDGVFTILHHYAPLAPSNLSPNNTIVSRLDAVQLVWNHNHPNPQSKFDLRWSTNQQTWNTVTRSVVNQYYNAPEELFPAGEIYWQVRTYSDAGIVSAWSNVAKFTAAIPSDAPIILSSPTTSIARPTFQWSQADQVAYQIIILDSVNQEVWNTGEVTSSNKAVTSGIDLLNYSTYKFRIRTETELGLWTQYSEQIITVSYTPPAKPTVIVDMTEAGVSFNINNPEPTGTEPFHSHNDLYKSIDDKWVRIAKELQSEYTDYSLASEEVAVYRVRAVSTDNDTFSESEVIEVSAKLKGIWIYDVENPSETIYMFLQSEANAVDVTYDREHGFRQFVGRKQPSIEWGSSENRIITARLALRDEEKEYEKLAYFPMNESTVLYRDYRGRKMYGTITEIQTNDQFYGNTVAVQITEIDYTEEV